MKRFARVFFLIALSVGSIGNSFAVTKCPGEPVYASWSSSNCSATSNSGSGVCGFSTGGATSGNNVSIGNAPSSGSCSASITCTSPSGGSSSDTVTVDGNQSRCCGNWSLSSQTVWNGSSCVAPPSNCNVAPFGTVNHGSSVTAYQSSSPTGSCVSETRTCTNGTLSGSYTNSSCAAGCSSPSGNITSGTSVTSYQTSSVPYGSSCTSQTRTCTNGSLSGSYGYSGCTVDSACPAGQYYSGGCQSCTAGYYCTGDNTRTLCPAGKTSPSGSSSSGQCYTPAVDTCGPSDGSTPQSSKPSGSSACSSGAYDGSSSYDSSNSWGWKCGSTASCSAPKYGCNALHATNYNATGPSNTYGCSGSCDSGYSWTGWSCTPISYSCSGTAPSGGNFTQRGAVTSDGTWNYAASGECTWSCNSGYSQSGNTCTPTVYSCSGTAPSGGNLTQRGAVTGNGTWSYAASGECTWSCNSGYSQSGNSCVVSTPPPSGSISVDSYSCVVPTGSATCSVNLTWSTTNPVTTSQVTANQPSSGTVIRNANSDTNYSVSVNPSWSGGVRYFLYHNLVELANTSPAVTATCAGRGYDTDSNTCRDPSVGSVTIVGNYYDNPADLVVTCNNSNAYEVTRGGTFVSGGAYPSTRHIPVTVAGNYSVVCKYGTVDSLPALIFYYTAPPAATVTLNATPRTITKDGSSILNWETKFPTNTCTLTAKVVCTNNLCTSDQNAWQTTISDRLATGNTDANDPNTQRSITTAVTTPAPGHKDVDWKGFGKKTITGIPFTTDFTLKCPTGQTETKRVQVTTSQEG